MSYPGLGGGGGGGYYSISANLSPIPHTQVTGLASWMDLVNTAAGQLDERIDTANARIDVMAKTIRIHTLLMVLVSLTNFVIIIGMAI